MATPNFAASNPGANPSLTDYLKNRIDGKAMRALRIERESVIAALKANNYAKPATVIWFNPVGGRLDGGVNFGIPSIINDAVPEREKLSFTYRGRKYPCTVLTIKDPYVFPWITDVKKEEDVEVGIYKIEVCKQIEIAHAFKTAYTFGSPNSSGMGGVLAFEGTRDALTRKDKNDRIILRVPTFVPLPNKKREYFCEDKFLDDELALTLDMQKRYTNIQTQQGQSYWDQEDQRGNITDIHKIWHQYELDMGWRTTAAPWITLTHDNAETCEGCGEPRKRATAFFCHKCARPYDPLKAYMAGEIGVDHPAMHRVKAEDWPGIRKEEVRRKSLREGIGETKQVDPNK